MTDKELRIKYGVSRKPLAGTHIMAHAMDASDFGGVQASAVLIFNSKTGTFIGCNVYGTKGADMRLGKNFDPTTLVHPIPGKDSESWKKWTKKGYKATSFAAFDVFEELKAEKPKAEKPVEAAAK